MAAKKKPATAAKRTQPRRSKTPSPRAAKQPRRGKRMRAGRGWRLSPNKKGTRTFAATLLTTMNVGSLRLAIFSVPK